MNEPIEVRVFKRTWWDGVDVLVRSGTCVAEPIILKKAEDGVEPRPTLRLGAGAAQVLMDDLWNCGFRPSEGTGSAGSLAATQRHLEDMRKLVFKIPVKG